MTFPAADFARMGKVSLVGAFDGIDLYSASTDLFQYSTNSDSFVVLGQQGGVQDLVQADRGGSITTLCFMPDASNGEQGTYYLGGNFTSLIASNDTSPTTFANIASYTSSTTSSTLVPLGKGLDGRVRTVHCDSKNRKVWAGGDFLAPVDDEQGGYKGSVAIWDTQAGVGGEWQPAAFGGLSGPVETITPNPNAGNGDAEQWLFGGEFVTRLAAGNSSWMNTTTSSSSTNATIIPADGNGNGTTVVYLNSTTSSLPSSPLGTLGNANSPYLTPIPLLTPISAIDAGPATSSAGHTNASSLLCANSLSATTQPSTRDQLETDAWWVRDGSVGKVTVNLYRVVRAGGVRLGNALDGGRRGTTSFRIVTIPDNNVRTLRYTDPATLLSTTCTSSCPLSLLDSINAQDFMFVSSNTTSSSSASDDDATELEITGFQIYLEGWTGDGAGLSLLQLLSGGTASSSAVAEENSAVCTGSNAVGQAATTTTTIQTTGNNWQVVETDTSIPGTIRRVLTTQIDTTSTERPSVIYYPFIATNGFYDLFVTTPGCARLPPAAGTCGGRTGNIDVEVFSGRRALPIVTTLDERSAGDSRALIYSGYLERSSEAFGVTVRLALATLPSGADEGVGQWTLVAGEVDAVFVAPAVNGTLGNSSSIPTGPTTIASGQVADGQVVQSVSSVNTTTTTTLMGHATWTLGYGTFAWSNTTIGGSGSNSNSKTGTTDGTALLLPANQTPLDALAFTFSRDQNATFGSTTAASGWSVKAFTSVPAASKTLLFVGGNFTTGNYSNLLVLDTSSHSVAAVKGGGVDGPVNSLIGWDRFLLVGGEFTALQQSTSGGSGVVLKNLAKYDTQSGEWTTLSGGVDGRVTTITLAADGHTLQVTGDFGTVFFRNGTRVVSGGVAMYDLEADDWSSFSSSAGRVWGSVRARANGSAIVGRIGGVSAYGASGLVSLSGDGQEAGLQVTGSAIGFAVNQSGQQTTTTTPGRRSVAGYDEALGEGGQAFALEILPHHVSTRSSAPWFDRRLSTSVLTKRQSSSSAQTSNAALSAMLADSYTAPSILTAAYYTNASSSSSEPWTIVGGNFTTATGVRNLGIWNMAQTIVAPVVSTSSRAPEDVVGIVRALQVVNDVNQGWLFVGGDRGFGWVDMTAQGKAGDWKSVPALGNGVNGNTTSGAVYAIGHRGSSSGKTINEQVIVAGAFTTAGSLGCVGVCSWDPQENRWSTLGDGLRSGVVSTMQVGGQNADNLLVAGSFVLSDGMSAAVAVYSFTNTSWTALGTADTLPGPIRAVTMDNGNIGSVWAAGQSTSDNQPFLMHWDGNSWDAQTSGLEAGTKISQLVFVPLSKAHTSTGNGSMESDRLLLATGIIRVPVQRVQGSTTSTVVVNATTALFDGQTWVPMLVGKQSDGSPAMGSGLFYSQESSANVLGEITKYPVKLILVFVDYLALGLIVLIAIAISTGLVFLITLVGLLVMFCWRPRDSSRPHGAATNGGEGHESEEERQRRLDAIQAAIFGEKAAAAAGFGTRTRKTEPVAPVVLAPPIRTRSSSSSSITSSSSLSKHEPEPLGRPTTVKYSFTGEDAREVTVMAGERIHVVEEAEGEEWWFVRTQDGREGVVPAAYIW
ncbi:hypothetical protein QFC22_005497 [Naganishia vaughanmartiniae]|uniref:Uncharacterized protein n=1 Tax=Naganishia vaughanmartiniae TaxID=1424756 RepID=A0ACC2WS72_9TREE|nr:hypothetical protein QFC22_005497 [Naganishia vaughanmartiniae]